MVARSYTFYGCRPVVVFWCVQFIFIYNHFRIESFGLNYTV